MHRYTRATWMVGVAAVSIAAACSDPLEVDNTNNPERNSVLNLPRDVEALAGRLYQNVHTASLGPNAGEGANDNLYPQLITSGLENASSLANNGMGVRFQMPRGGIDNNPGNPQLVGNRRDFRNLQNAARTAATVFERLNAQGFTSGSAANDARLRAFTWFGYGTALGNVALAYDSAAIPRPGDGENTPALVAYDSVMRTALRALDSAQAVAGTQSFSIPSNWLAQSSDMPRDNFVRLIRAYKARLRAGVARNPAERERVDWAAVVADAQAGLADDFVLQLNPSGGWDYVWNIQHYTTGAANWHQMPYHIIGFADTSGAYDTWLATPLNNRQRFLILTPDLRFPRGATRAEQQANTPLNSMPAGVYFRNRAGGEDQPSFPYGESQYDHNRWRALNLAVRVGPWVTFSKVENDMLAAEGLIRLNRIAEAAALIDRSRTRNGLPALTGVVTSRTQEIPGGRGCVPRVPDAARNFAATKCGDIFEAMKWEKRMESAFAGWGVWYFEGRGWGDLPVGTAIHWPVPFGELQARLQPIYSLGGVGRPGGSAASTYGFGADNR